MDTIKKIFRFFYRQGADFGNFGDDVGRYGLSDTVKQRGGPAALLFVLFIMAPIIIMAIKGWFKTGNNYDGDFDNDEKVDALSKEMSEKNKERARKKRESLGLLSEQEKLEVPPVIYLPAPEKEKKSDTSECVDPITAQGTLPILEKKDANSDSSKNP